MEARILRINEVAKYVGLHRSTVYRMINRNEFPAPLRLGPNAIGWRREEIEEWIATRKRIA